MPIATGPHCCMRDNGISVSCAEVKIWNQLYEYVHTRLWALRTVVHMYVCVCVCVCGHVHTCMFISRRDTGSYYTVPNMTCLGKLQGFYVTQRMWTKPHVAM